MLGGCHQMQVSQMVEVGVVMMSVEEDMEGVVVNVVYVL